VPIPPVTAILLSAIVGIGFLLQQKPLVITFCPPSEITLAVHWIVIPEIRANEISDSVGRACVVLKLMELPYVVPFWFVA
jgi:hypothetical protein